MKSDSVIFIFSWYSHFRVLKRTETQKPELLKKLYINSLNKEDVSISKMIKILKQLKNSVTLNWTKLNWTELNNWDSESSQIEQRN